MDLPGYSVPVLYSISYLYLTRYPAWRDTSAGSEEGVADGISSLTHSHGGGASALPLRFGMRSGLEQLHCGGIRVQRRGQESGFKVLVLLGAL